MYLAGLILQTNMGSMCVQFAALIAPNQDIAFVLAAGASRVPMGRSVWMDGTAMYVPVYV